MNRKENHAPGCDCSECILAEDESLIDLTPSINIDGVYCLNERVHGSIRKILKIKEMMTDKADFVQSNEGDPELLIYIPFSKQVKMKSMTMIGGEDGTSPSNIKLFVNNDHPDFDLVEATPAQSIECVENPNGGMAYNLTPAKFNSVWSVTIIVTRNYYADHSKIYYIGFTGVTTNKKKAIMLGMYELKPLPDQIKTKEPNVNQDLIYG